MKKALIVVGLLLFPGVSFAAQNEAVRTSVLQTLLSQFVAQVNAIDSIQNQIATADDPSAFAAFKSIIEQQLAYTQKSISTLINPIADMPIAPAPVEAPAAGSTAPQSLAEISVTQNDKDGESIFTVMVLNDAGKPIQGANVKFTTPQDKQGEVRPTGNHTTPTSTDWKTWFSYRGVKGESVTFTSGELTKTITF